MGRPRAVEAVTAEALERLDRAAVVGVEPFRPREHSTSARARRASPRSRGDRTSMLVEERRDRVVVARRAAAGARADCRTPRASGDGLGAETRFGGHLARSYAVVTLHAHGHWGLYLVVPDPAADPGLRRPGLAEEDRRAEHAGPGRAPASPAREVARQILDRNGLQDVPVEPSPGGPLSDHYDPRKRSVHLSRAGLRRARGRLDGDRRARGRPRDPAREGVRAVPGALGDVARRRVCLERLDLPAHDRRRSRSSSGLIGLAIVLYAVVVLFQLVTLPVEFDASRRALVQLRELGLVSTGRVAGAAEGAHRGGDDVRRRRARRALAARVLRARSSSATATRARSRRARDRTDRARRRRRRVASAFVFSVLVDGAPKPAIDAARAADVEVVAAGAKPAAKPVPSRSRSSRPGSSTIVATGDIVMGSTPNLPPDGGRSFFADVQADLAGDVVLGNLEGTLSTGGGSKCGAGQHRTATRSRRPRRTRAGSSQAGFTVMNLANNHAYDFGASGPPADDRRAAGASASLHTGRPGQVTVQQVGQIRVALVGFASYPWAARRSTDIAAARPRARRRQTRRRRRRDDARGRRGHRPSSTSHAARSASSARTAATSCASRTPSSTPEPTSSSATARTSCAAWSGTSAG